MNYDPRVVDANAVSGALVGATRRHDFCATPGTLFQLELVGWFFLLQGIFKKLIGLTDLVGGNLSPYPQPDGDRAIAHSGIVFAANNLAGTDERRGALELLRS